VHCHLIAVRALRQRNLRARNFAASEGSDLASKWQPIEKKNSKMVFIGIELPQDLITDGLDACLVK